MHDALEYGREKVRQIKEDVAADPQMSDRWEEHTDLFIEAIRTAKVFIDCGCEFGFYLQLARRYGRRELLTFAFEPDPVRYQVLMEEFDSAVILPFAVADCVSKRIATQPNHEYSLSVAGLHAHGIQFEVDTIPLDFIADSAINADVLKMDIEGAEDAAFRGMTKLLARSPKLKLFIEFHPTMSPSAAEAREATVAMLEHIGYLFSPDDEARARFGGRVALEREPL